MSCLRSIIITDLSIKPVSGHVYLTCTEVWTQAFRVDAVERLFVNVEEQESNFDFHAPLTDHVEVNRLVEGFFKSNPFSCFDLLGNCF